MTQVMFKRGDDPVLWRAALAGKILRLVASDPANAYPAAIGRELAHRKHLWSKYDNTVSQVLAELEDASLLKSEKLRRKPDPHKIRLYRLTEKGAMLLALSDEKVAVVY